jgi:hypothetical protein
VKRSAKRIILVQNFCHFLGARICSSPLEKKNDGVYWIRKELVCAAPEEKYERSAELRSQQWRV